METIVDQLDAVNSNSFLKEIKNPENIKNLIIKNYNKDTEWSDLDKFINLEKLQLNNCLIENNSFFLSISKIKKLKTLKYDYECYFKSSEEKTKINLLSINKIILDFKSYEETNLSLLSIADNQSNFINSFPNFPNAYQNIEELELNNYDVFLENIKKKDYNFDYQDIYQGKDIFYSCDIYNLSRLKKLNNINFSTNKNNKKLNDTILDKILSLPNHKQIKINKSFIKDIKDDYFKGQKMYLDYTYYPYDDNIFNDLKKHSSYSDCIVVHWPSQKYNGYKDKFKELLKQEINHIIIGPTFDFFWEFYEDYNGSSIDDFEKEFLKIKNLKKITFEFPSKPTFHDDEQLTFENKDYEGRIIERFVGFIHLILKKNIEIEIDFKDIKNAPDINESHDEYVQLFYLFMNIQDNKKLKNKFKIKNLTVSQCEEYFEKIVLNKFKSIVVIDDQSNSEILKKFKNIEILHDYSLDWGLEVLSINSGLLNYEVEKIKSKKEEVFKDFLYEDENWYQQFSNEKHLNNPGKSKILIKKSWLDNSKKIIFNNLETVSFHYIGKKIFYSDESYLKNKKFLIPNSINHKSIKDLSITNSPCLSLQDLEIFENLETLVIGNHLDENKLNYKTLPKFEKLKDLKLDLYYPIIKEKSGEALKNLEKSLNLENIKISGIYNTSEETGKWSLSDVKFENIHNLKKLKKLEINGISMEDLKVIKNLENLVTFKLINPTVITKDMNSDEGTIDPPMTVENLLFIKDMKNLKELELYLPRFDLNSNNFNPKKLISLINPNVKKLELRCGYPMSKIDYVHKIYNETLSSLKELENLKINLNCIDAPILKYNDKIEGAYEKAERKRNSDAKDPIVVDFLKIKKMKNLNEIEIDIDPYFGIKTLNTIEIINCKNLSDIKLKFDYRKFKIDIKELNLIFDKISTERQQFLIKMNKDKAYKDKDLVDSRYDLNEDDREKYDQIEEKDERNISINGDSLSNMIFETYKKKIKK